MLMPPPPPWLRASCLFTRQIDPSESRHRFDTCWNAGEGPGGVRCRLSAVGAQMKI